MLQPGNQLPALPSAVRNYEIEEPTFFAWFLLLEQSLRFARQFEQPNPFLKIGLIGGLMSLDFTQATILPGAPLSGHAIKKCAVYLPVELVHVHGVHATLKPVVFGPKPANRCLVLSLSIGVAGVERVAEPGEDFLVECQPAKELREPVTDDFLADIGFVAPALVSRAMVIDVVAAS